MFNAIASAGSYDTYKAVVSLAGKVSGVEYFLGFSKLNSKGLSSANDSTGTANFEHDFFRQHLFQASVGGKILKKLDARIYGKYNANRTDIDAGAFTDDKDYRLKNKNFIAGTKLVYAFPSGALNFNYNYNRYKRHIKDDSGHVGGINSPNFFYYKFQEGTYNSKSQFAELYSNVKLQKHVELLAGVDFRKNGSDQSSFSLSNYGPFSSLPLSQDSIRTKQYSGYASLMLKDLSGFYIEAGGRWNHHSIYGDNLTYSFGGSYLIKKVKIFANLSSGFRAPSLYQLYSEYGNKDLKPEESINTELGIQYSGNHFSSRLVGFSRRITDVFTFYSDPVTFAGKYINDDKQKDHGLEAEASYNVAGKFSISANYTWVDGKITTDNGSGKDSSYFNLYRRPAHTVNLNAGYSLTPSFYLSAHLHLISKFYEPLFGMAPIEMKGFYTINFYSEYSFKKRIKLFADLRNITAQKYFETRGFNSKRFNVNAGVSVTL